MADIKFYCTKCQSKLAIDGSAAGYTIDCPDCGETLTVPAQSADAPDDASTRPAPPAETQKIAPMPPSSPGAEQGLKARIKTLEEDRKRFEEALELEQARTSGFSRLEAKIAELLQQLETARAAQEAAEKNAKRIIKDKHALSEQLQQAEKSLLEKNAAAREATKELEQLRAEKERATTVDEQRAAELKRLQEQVAGQAELVNRIDALEKEKSALEKDRALAEAQWQDAHAEVERLTKAQAAGTKGLEELSHANERVAAAETRVQELKGQLAAASQAGTSREKQAQTVQVRLDAALVKMEALEQEKNKLRQAVTFATEEAERIQIRLSETEGQAKEITRLRARVKELESTPPEKERPEEPAPAPVASKPPPPAVVREEPVRPGPVTVRHPSLYTRPTPPGKRPHKRLKLVYPAAGVLLLAAMGSGAWLFRDTIRSAFGGGAPVAPHLHASALTTTPPKPPPPLSAESRAIVDGVEVTLHQVAIDHILRVDPLGNEMLSEKPYLILDIALHNTSKHDSIFMLHTWDQSTLTDDLEQSRRPAFPTRYALDHIVGTLGATEIKPGQTVEDRLVFEVPSSEARSFTLSSDPGFWKQAEEGRYQAASRSSLTLTFNRDQIVVP